MNVRRIYEELDKIGADLLKVIHLNGPNHVEFVIDGGRINDIGFILHNYLPSNIKTEGSTVYRWFSPRIYKFSRPKKETNLDNNEIQKILM